MLSRIRVIQILALVVFTVSLSGNSGTVAADSGSVSSQGAQYCVQWNGTGPLSSRVRCFTSVAEKDKFAKELAIQRGDSGQLLFNYRLWLDAGYQPYALELNGYDCDSYTIIDIWQGWNDVTSSLEAGSCNGIRLYDGAGGGSPSWPYIGDVYYVGDAANDKASSVRLDYVVK